MRIARLGRSALRIGGLALLALCTAFADGGAAADGSADAKGAPRRVFFVGHSLISDVPDIVAHFATAARSPFEFTEQFVPGAPLRWQWDEEERSKREGYTSPFQPPFQGSYHVALARGDWDAIVLVDSVPRGGAEAEAESIDYLARFALRARETNPGVRVLFYEPWHCIDSGTPKGCGYDKTPNAKLPWRERVDADGAMWERIVAGANAKLPDGARPIELIPVARALGRLADAIEKGEVEGLASWRDLFVDDIHLGHVGKYFAALVTHGALTGRVPTDPPADARNRWGKPYWNEPNWQGHTWPRPSAAALRRFANIASAVSERSVPD